MARSQAWYQRRITPSARRAALGVVYFATVLYFAFMQRHRILGRDTTYLLAWAAFSACDALLLWWLYRLGTLRDMPLSKPAPLQEAAAIVLWLFASDLFQSYSDHALSTMALAGDLLHSVFVGGALCLIQVAPGES